MFCYRNVQLPKCSVTEMSSYRNVLLPKCPVTKMSVTKTSITKVSFTKMSGYPLVGGILKLDYGRQFQLDTLKKLIKSKYTKVSV